MADKPEVAQADWDAALGIKGRLHSLDSLTAVAAAFARHRTSQSESDAVRELVDTGQRFIREISAEGGTNYLGPATCRAIADLRTALTRYRGEGS